MLTHRLDLDYAVAGSPHRRCGALRRLLAGLAIAGLLTAAFADGTDAARARAGNGGVAVARANGGTIIVGDINTGNNRGNVIIIGDIGGK